MKKILSISMVINVMMFGIFTAFEPQLASAVEDQIQISQTVTSGISIDSPADVSMSRALTLTEHTAIGSAVWTVITNNQAGYTLSVSASSTSPCPISDGVRAALCDMSNSEGFTDMATSSKATWSVTNDYMFGYSALGNDVTGHGTDTDCQGATSDDPSSTLLYQGFDGTVLIEIASSTSETDQAGTATTLCLGVEQDTVFAPTGSYQATTTATAVVY